MKLAEVLRLAIPIADALDARARRRHRASRPEASQHHGDGRRLVKILDFGLAKLVDLESPTSSPTTVTVSPSDSPISIAGTIVGTPAYMSPEQADGRRRGCAQRHLQFRRDPLRDGHRPPRVHRETPPRKRSEPSAPRTEGRRANWRREYRRISNG